MGDKPHDSTPLDLVGFGLTETKTGTQTLPVSTASSFTAVGCPWLCGFSSNVMCIHSGAHSDVTSCGGDSGGPWFTRDEHDQIVIVAVNSFGFERFLFTCNPFYDPVEACGSHSKETGISPISGDRTFIETYAPGYFQWTRINDDDEDCWFGDWWC